MNRLWKIYEDFSVMLTEDKIYEDPTISYADICRELGVNPADLDAVLIAELGYTGECLMAEYRKEKGPQNIVFGHPSNVFLRKI